MSYLQKLGLGKARYDKYPFVSVNGHESDCWVGWEAIGERLRESIQKSGKHKVVIAMECYTGILDDEVVPALREQLSASSIHITRECAFKTTSDIEILVEPYLGGNDPIFGFMASLCMEDYLDAQKVKSLQDELSAATEGIHLVYGPGALLCCEPDWVVYLDMPRWEGQLRQRRNQVSNLGMDNAGLKVSLQYKHSFFVDWPVCDQLKRDSMDAWDFLLDTCVEDEPKLITGAALRAGLKQATCQPFRVVPFFDPGPWGGQWMREVCDLPDGPPNYAWCFDCVPEENSLLLGFKDIRVEVPSINLVLRHPEALLGEPVYGLCGAWFPIRFDFLDTMQGGNLSFQVHPVVDYARKHFGIPFTQDESYYILDAEEGACVYLGLKEGIEGAEMLTDLSEAQKDPEHGFDDEKYVAKWPARKHDHFLIPAGTCHCSGSDSMVLEISHTPYIFTFKLWDWGRLGLDGKPRPINIERGKSVIRWERTEAWVKENLINAVEPISAGEGWREERTGLYKSEYIETRRHWFNGAVEHDTGGASVHVLNLVQGEEAIVKSPTHAFKPYIVHYAETFIIPAAIGKYTIEPHGPSVGKECATLKAYMRINP